MEILLALIIIIIFALSYLCEKATNFLRELRKSKSGKILGKGFEAKLAVVPIDKKSEVCVPNTNPNLNEDFE